MQFSGRTWRPPYERWTPIIEATSGCAWGRCAFCSLYENERFSIAPPLERFCRDVDELKATVPNARRLWLTGGDPFQMGFRHLEQRALAVRDRLIKIQTVAMFASVRDIMRYSDDELRRLASLRIGGLTIGMESAHDPTLVLADKGYTGNDVREQCLRLERAGMEYSLAYMTGLAGAGRCAAATRESLEILNDLRPRFIGISSLTLFPGTRLAHMADGGQFAPAGEIERIEELALLIEGIRFKTFLDARSASNAIPVADMLPYERERMLAHLRHEAARTTEADLAAYRRNLNEL